MSDRCPQADNSNPHPSDCEILEGYRARSRTRAEVQDSDEARLLFAKAEPIRLLLLDVDGVLTDGSLIYSENESESKAFNTQDGLGIFLIQQAEVEVGLISARASKIVRRRAEELAIKYIFQGVGKKIEIYKELLNQTGLKPYQICYIGDDWIDLPILSRVGLAACPVDSVPEVRDVCHFVTSRPGGRGAVREVCDLIIRAKGVHGKLLQQFLG